MNTRIRSSLIVIFFIPLFSQTANAVDLTGSWEGKWKCKYFSGGAYTSDENVSSTMKISQSGEDLNVVIDDNFFNYHGIVKTSNTNANKGAASFISCKTDTTLIAPSGYNELISAKVAVNPQTGGAVLTAVSTGQQFTADAVSSICHYTMKRVNTDDPLIPPC